MANINGKVNQNGNISTNLINGTIDISAKVQGSNKLDSSLEKNQIDSTGQLNGSTNVSPESLKSLGNINVDFNNIPASGYGYVYFKYSHNEPTKDSDMLNQPDNETYYIGVISTNQISPPTNFNAYTWTRIRGEDGEKGEKGDKGDKGDSGETSLIVINPLYFEGYLNTENWITDNTSRDSTFYYQKREVTELTLLTSTMTQEELIEYMNIKMTDKVTPVIDLIVSNTSVLLGMEQMEQWKYLSRVYMTKEELADGSNFYYINFECYKRAPNVQLKYQVKVI